MSAVSIQQTTRVVVATGIGGQGVQLAAQVLASAAMFEGFEVQLVASYGGMMRGGNTEATIAIGEGPVEVPPVAPTTWAGLLMHHEHLDQLVPRLTATSVVYVNSSVVPAGVLAGAPGIEVRVPAVELAVEAGDVLAASMVLLGALAGGTGLVSLDSLEAAATAALPSYRAQHAALNHRALGLGYAFPFEGPQAWSTDRGTS